MLVAKERQRVGATRSSANSGTEDLERLGLRAHNSPWLTGSESV
jgi:hypothetical protein